MECRICLIWTAADQLVALSDRLSDQIAYCTSIQMEFDERFPSRVCLICLERLKISCDFKTLCQRSVDILRNRLHRIKIENSHHLNDTENSSDNCENFFLEKTQDENHVDGAKFSENFGFQSVGKLIGVHKNFDSKSDVSTVLTDLEDLQNDSLIADVKCDKFSVPDQIVQKSKLPQKIKVKMKTFCKDSIDKKIKSANYNRDETQIAISQNKEIKLRGATREQCSTCGKIVSTKFRLKMHLRTHTGEKPFNCRFCEKTFGTAQNLKVHERVHTGEKPLLCGVCGKGFAQSAGLVAHMRLHTGELPYKCTLCTSSFRTPGHLQYHIKQHTGEKKHECTHCKKAFISRGDLTQHLKIHTGERPYVCSVCGFRMARLGHLHRHMMIHSGEKPHKCHTCDNSFTQKGDLVRHMKKHSKLDSCKLERIPNHIDENTLNIKQSIL